MQEVAGYRLKPQPAATFLLTTIFSVCHLLKLIFPA